MYQKKKILICMEQMSTGGVATSLISLLNALDYEKLEVDLIFSRDADEWMKFINPNVNVLPPAMDERNYILAKLKKLVVFTLRGWLPFYPFYMAVRGKQYPFGKIQLMSGLARVSVSRRLKKRYDVAIGYMEGFPNYFINKKVNAVKKAAYIHNSYTRSGMDSIFDRKYFEKTDKIVLVTQESLDDFAEVWGKLADKATVVHNILPVDDVRKRSLENPQDFHPDKNYLNIVTAARLDNRQKRLDRAIEVMRRMTGEGKKVRWYVFGEGDDRAYLERLIKKYRLEDVFMLMGNRSNVLPYVRMADVFAMTSAFEGRPIAVDEALAVGTPVIAASYASAVQQIDDGVTGIITENSTKGVYEAVNYIYSHRKVLDKFRENLRSKRFNTTAEEFMRLIEE